MDMGQTPSMASDGKYMQVCKWMGKVMRNGWIFGLTNVKLQSYIELPNF